MEELKKKYDEIVKKREKIVDKLNILQKHAIIKEYNMLKADNSTLLKEQKELEEQIKLNAPLYCDHILITTYLDWEYTSKGCIKCGMSDDLSYCCSYGKEPKNMITYNYLKDRQNLDKFLSSKTIDVQCDLELAHAIYNKIIEAHPDIDDDTLINYFENALDHIRNVDVNNNRKINRARRLNLSNNFNPVNKK